MRWYFDSCPVDIMKTSNLGVEGKPFTDGHDVQSKVKNAKTGQVYFLCSAALRPRTPPLGTLTLWVPK